VWGVVSVAHGEVRGQVSCLTRKSHVAVAPHTQNITATTVGGACTLDKIGETSVVSAKFGNSKGKPEECGGFGGREQAGGCKFHLAFPGKRREKSSSKRLEQKNSGGKIGRQTDAFSLKEENPVLNAGPTNRNRG